jgi:membrane protease YdiL (CAAX protease family)
MIASAILGVLLLVVLPVRALIPKRVGAPRRSLPERYARTSVEIAALLAGLMVVSLLTGMTASDLGLGWPPALAGQAGLAAAALILAALAVTVVLMSPSKSPREQSAMAELPSGPREMRLFLLFGIAAGVGWEVLYRGFLLWWLTPLIGLAGAIVAASVAYGLAHGWKSWGQGLGSIGSAFLFTIGFAATGSLWWLIAIHSGLPLVALLAGWRARDGKKEPLSA